METGANYFVFNQQVPDFRILIPKLLLLGDLFEIPYSLAGVEWTLRVEILFYLTMFFLKALGALRFTKFIPIGCAALSLALYISGPMPNWTGSANGYLSTFAPYLLIGVVTYLAEKKLANPFVSIASVIVMVWLSMIQVRNYNPALAHSSFIQTAIIVFGAGWILRHRITAGRIITNLSSMTYAIYLTHYWMWGYLGLVVQEAGVDILPLSLIHI